ncbi:hypothetical protein F5887DRAFT_916783 [Amanita rubescens]|nr:hypothetical protein F5887DRAFT_916783 [Amanita rubescens]
MSVKADIIAQQPGGLASGSLAVIHWSSTDQGTAPYAHDIYLQFASFSILLFDRTFHNSFALKNNVQNSVKAVIIKLPTVPPGCPCTLNQYCFFDICYPEFVDTLIANIWDLGTSSLDIVTGSFVAALTSTYCDDSYWAAFFSFPALLAYGCFHKRAIHIHAPRDTKRLYGWAIIGGYTYLSKAAELTSGSVQKMQRNNVIH